MMRRRFAVIFRTFCLFLLAAAVLAPSVFASESDAGGDVASATGWMDGFRPPMAFSNVRIRLARDRVQRVGWSEAVVDGQTGDDPSPAERVWASTVKAALFGGGERAQAAAALLAEAAKKAFENIDEKSKGILLPFLEAYDCLNALPEWAELDEELQARMREILREASVRIDEDNVRSPNSLLWDRSVLLYAGCLTGATPCIQAAIEGDEIAPGFVELVRREIQPEGVRRNAPLSVQVVEGPAFMLACAALNVCAPDIHASLEPLIRRSILIVAELAYPTGRFPSVIERAPTAADLARYLERGDALTGGRCVKAVLNQLYKQVPRRAESLLFVDAFGERDERLAFHSFALPQTGSVVLNDATGTVPLSMYLDTGLSGARKASALLSMEWKNDWSVAGVDRDAGTDAFNTVIVDRKSHAAAPESDGEPRNAFLYSCKSFDDGSSYVKATAQGQYSERAAYPQGSVSTMVSTYERVLYTASPYAVDLFRVRGGGVHDWIYHAPPLAVKPDGDWNAYSPQAGEYPWLAESSGTVQSTVLKGIYSFTFRPAQGTTRGHRIWIVDPAGTQWIVARNGERTTLIGRRQTIEDEGDLFAVLYEWFDGSAPSDITIERLAMGSGANRRDFQANAFAVTQGEESHVFLSAMTPDATYNAEFDSKRIVFQGAFGHVCVNKGQTTRVRLIGGTLLRYDVHGVQTNAALNFGVVRSVDAAKGIVEAEFSNRLPTGDTLRGDVMTALTTKAAPVMYRPLTIESVERSDPTEMFQLRCLPNAPSTGPGLGAAAAVGDQLIFENAAELIWKNNDAYELQYSAPADATIEGATNRNRVFFSKTNRLSKLRGESMAGVIQFHADPDESVDGRLEFFRIP